MMEPEVVVEYTKEDSTLLILATDLLSYSKQLPNHHSRIHSRFAKLGLATKVHLKDVNVDGISNSSSLWFYNVQGLFHVSFEYLNIEIQKSCLLHFTNFWLSAIDQELLPESLDLVYDDDANTDLLVCQPEVDWSCNESDCLQSAAEIHQHQLIGTRELSATKNDMVPGERCLTEYDEVEVNTVVKCNHFVATDHDRLYASICNRLRIIDDVAAAEDITRKLCSLLKFFWSECFAGDDSTTSTVFPFNILNQYVETFGEDSVFDESTPSSSNDTYDVEGRHGAMLRLVCEWVGNEFSRLHGIISERADRFKTQNIERIESLPSARHTVDFIFPQCMVILILRWMDAFGGIDSSGTLDNKKMAMRRTAGSESGKQKPAEVVYGDHCYTANCSSDPVFAFVQLILEFANGCLVSGITHVIYPRLLQAQL